MHEHTAPSQHHPMPLAFDSLNRLHQQLCHENDRHIGGRQPAALPPAHILYKSRNAHVVCDASFSQRDRRGRQGSGKCILDICPALSSPNNPPACILFSHDPNTIKHPHATHLRLLHIVSKAVEPAYLSNPNPCMHLHPSTHLRLVHLVSEAVEPVYILIQPSFLHAAATHLRLLHLVSQTIKQRCEELVGVLLPCSTPVAGPLPHGLAHDLGTDGRRAGITEATRPGE